MKPARVYPEKCRRGFAPILIIFAIILLIPLAHFANKRFIGIRYPWEPAPFYDGNICPDEFGNVKIVFGDCPSISPRPTPFSTKSAETANWKTYTNSKYGFEFNYPYKWNIKEKNNTTYDYVTLYENNIADTTGNIGIKLEKIDSQITTDSGASTKFQAFMDSCSLQTPTKSTRKNSDDYKLEKQVKIADKIAFQTYGGCCMDFGRHVFLYQNTTSYRFTLFNLGQETSGLKNEDVFNQILSTFKFPN